MSGHNFLPPNQCVIRYDLARVGLPEIPLVGIHDAKRALPGLCPHVHPGTMEICYLTRGERIYHVNQRG